MDARIFILILISLVSFAFVAGMYVEHKNNNTTALDDKLDDKNGNILNYRLVDCNYTENTVLIQFEIQKDIYNDVVFVKNGNVLHYRLVDSNYTENTVLIQFEDYIFNGSIYMYYDKIEPTQDCNFWWNHSYSTRREITISENNTSIIDDFNSSGTWS